MQLWLWKQPTRCHCTG